MADGKVRIELIPHVRVTLADGQCFTFTQADLEAFTYTLIIEGLLVLSLPDQKKVLSMMQLELVNDDEGRMVLRPSGITENL